MPFACRYSFSSVFLGRCTTISVASTITTSQSKPPPTGNFFGKLNFLERIIDMRFFILYLLNQNSDLFNINLLYTAQVSPGLFVRSDHWKQTCQDSWTGYYSDSFRRASILQFFEHFPLIHIRYKAEEKKQDWPN